MACHEPIFPCNLDTKIVHMLRFSSYFQDLLTP